MTKPILGRSAKIDKFTLGRSASKVEKPQLSGNTRANILGSQSLKTDDIDTKTAVTKEQNMVQQYPSAYAATNAIPAAIKVNTGYKFEWDYLQTFSDTELKSLIKHEANCRAANDLNQRNLIDITSDIASDQRELCYLIKLNGNSYVIEGWRRTTGAIIAKAPLTFAVCDLDAKLKQNPNTPLPTYTNTYELVDKLSVKEGHSLRDHGLHYFNYINKHKVTRPQCAKIHGISLPTLNRNLVSAQVSSEWLVIFDSFKDFSRSNFATLNAIELSIQTHLNSNDAITDAALESSDAIADAIKESNEPLSIAKILDLIVCPLNEIKQKKKDEALTKPKPLKSNLREFNDDRKAVLTKCGPDFKVELSNLSEKDSVQLTELIKEFIANIE